MRNSFYENLFASRSKAMRVNNKVLSVMLALGLTTSMAMPMFLAGCSASKTQEETKVTATEDPGTTENNEIGPKPIRLEDDFYGYVNAEELRNTEIDPRYGMAGAFMDAELITQEQLDTTINTIAESDEEFEDGSNGQLIHDFFHQIMNFDITNSDACKELEEVITRILSVRSLPELIAVTADLIFDLGIDPFFGFDIMDGVERPDEYTLFLGGNVGVLGFSYESLQAGEEARVNLNNTVYENLRALGYSDTEAKAKADELTKLAIDLSSDYKAVPMMLSSMKMYTDDEIKSYFDVNELTKAKGFENPYGRWCMMNEDAFIAFTEKWNDESNLEAFKTWLALSVVQRYGEFLAAGNEELAKLYGENTKARDDYARDMVKTYMEVQLGEEYAKYFYTEETDQAVRDMCEQIRDSYREVISGADWLSEETRAGLLRKLENIQFITGAGIPHEIDPKDAELIGKDAWETQMNLISKSWEDKIESLSKPRPVQGQSMSPQTVNACFWTDNVVRITIAIVNPPFFSADADPNANLGGLGMVIGHEIGHAFDSDGLNWDENGIYNPSWISQEDREALAERSQKCAEYYDQFTIMGVYHVDGELTLTENFADLGSMQVITNIAKTKEEREVLFENYALIWAGIQSDVSGIDNLKTDLHSPATVRVNAVLSTCEAFYETYDIKEGDGMYIEPSKRVSRW